MKHDIAGHIGAVTRKLETRVRDGRPAQVVIAARVYDTTVDDLWDALTNRERIPRWFLPVSGELRLGGRYQLEGNAGGTITRCEPPRVVAMTWEFGGDVSWVEVTLDPTADGRAHLHLEHMAHVPGPRWDEFGPGAVGVGWDLTLFGLANHVTSGAAKPDNPMAWLMSDEGKSFVRRSSDDWCRASIAAGTGEAAARAAAARTTAAYTGAAPEAAAPDAQR